MTVGTLTRTSRVRLDNQPASGVNGAANHTPFACPRAARTAHTTNAAKLEPTQGAISAGQELAGISYLSGIGTYHSSAILSESR